MIIGIIKPKGPTSHDIIYQVRRITGVKRVGHAGTLDPAASGVLVVAIGREFTKQLGEIVKHDKEYVAIITLGSTSTTDDGEGEISKLQITNDKYPIEKDINVVIKQFVGKIEQVPPAFSAIKMGGKKAYELARSGKKMVMEPREVVVHSIEVVKYDWPELTIKVHCGKGTYIRSLARDIGQALGVGGYMSALERTRVGEFTLEKCYSLEQLKELWMEKSRQSQTNSLNVAVSSSDDSIGH